MAASIGILHEYQRNYINLLDRADRVFPAKFQGRFTEPTYNIKLHLGPYHVEVEVLLSSSATVARVRIERASTELRTNFGKMFLFCVLSFHKSRNLTTMQTLANLYHIYSGLNADYDGIFQMQVLDDTSADLIFNGGDNQKFLNRFGPLDDLYVAYLIAHGQTAVQQLGKFDANLDDSVEFKPSDSNHDYSIAVNSFTKTRNEPAGGIIGKDDSQTMYENLDLIQSNILQLQQQLNVAKEKKNKEEIIRLNQSVKDAFQEWQKVTHIRVCKALYNRINFLLSSGNNDCGEEMDRYRRALHYYRKKFKDNKYFQLVTGKGVIHGKIVPLHLELKSTQALVQNMGEIKDDSKKDRSRYLLFLKTMIKDDEMDDIVHPIMDVILDTTLDEHEVKPFLANFKPDDFKLSELRTYQSAWWNKCVTNVMSHMESNDFPFTFHFKNNVFRKIVLPKIKPYFVIGPPRAPLGHRVVMVQRFRRKSLTRRRQHAFASEKYNRHVYQELAKFVRFLKFKDTYNTVKAGDYTSQPLRPEILEIISFPRKLKQYKTLLQQQKTNISQILKKFKDWIQKPENTSCDHFRLEIPKIMSLLTLLKEHKHYFTSHIQPFIEQWFCNKDGPESYSQLRELIEPFLQFCQLAQTKVLDIKQDYITEVEQTKKLSSNLLNVLNHEEEEEEEEEDDDESVVEGGRKRRKKMTVRKKYFVYTYG
jgi:hypothetical protein